MEKNGTNLLLEQWEQKERERQIEQYNMARKKLYGIYLPVMFVIIVGALVGIGVMVEATIQEIFRIHVVAGLGLFVLSALPLMFMNSKPRVINRFIKELQKEQNAVLQTEEDKYAYAKDMLENGNGNIYKFLYNNDMVRVFFGKRFILHKDVTYYILVDAQKVEALSLDGYSFGKGAGRTRGYYIVFHYPSSGKKSLFFDVDKKKMRFDGEGNRDEVFDIIKNTYNIPVIEK